jgi:hypothetical protein
VIEENPAENPDTAVPAVTRGRSGRGRPRGSGRGGYRGGVRGKKQRSSPGMKAVASTVAKRRIQPIQQIQFPIQRKDYKGPHGRQSPNSITPPDRRLPRKKPAAQHDPLEDSSPGTPGSPELCSSREENRGQSALTASEDIPEPFASPAPPPPEGANEVAQVISPGTLFDVGMSQLAESLENGDIAGASNAVEIINLSVCVENILTVLFSSRSLFL